MNLTLIKYLLVMATAPIWFPFVKALWEEFRDAMRVDGGVFGDAPSRRHRDLIEEQIAREEPRVVNETLAHARERRRGRRAEEPPSGYRGYADAGSGRARRRGSSAGGFRTR